VSRRKVSKIVNEFKSFLSSPTLLPPSIEELVIKRYVKRLFELNLTIVSGFPACVLSILDEAMVPYEDVFELVTPYSVVAVEPELAEKIFETMGGEVGKHRPPWFIPTCHIGEKCFFHVYNARGLDLVYIVKHIVILRHVNDLITEYIVFGRCEGEAPSEVYVNCLKQLVNEMLDIAKRKEYELLVKAIDDPFKVYCTPDILIKHGQLTNK